MNAPTYPKSIMLDASSPMASFDTVEDHIAGEIPLTVIVPSCAGLSDDWLNRVSQSPQITLVYRPDPVPVVEPVELPVLEPAVWRIRGSRTGVAVVAAAIFLSATVVALVARFGLGI